MHPNLPPELSQYDWPQIIRENVKTALTEDLGPNSIDVTALLIEPATVLVADLWARENCRLAGQDWFTQSFKEVDPTISVEWRYHDGDDIPKDTLVATVRGPARAVLTAERTAINFLQTLSGTATKTAQWYTRLDGLPVALLDTRKTIPGLRYAQKYAVFCGGGKNHRMGLFDQFLIKENHIAAAGGIAEAITKAKTIASGLKVEVEVENWDEFIAAVDAQADIIMLDNFSLEGIREAVQWLQLNKPSPRPLLEASGNITIENLVEYAQTGVDCISSGSLTKSVTAIDFSLRYRE